MYVGSNSVRGIALGTQIGRKLILGGATLWAKGYNVSYSLVNVTTNGVSFISDGNPFAATLTIESGYYLIPSSVSVMMGETDVTSLAYDSTTNTISIADVIDDVTITAEATLIIVFEDSAAKAVCVSNWGGNYVSGEITVKETAAVTNIAPTSSNAYFKGCQMVKFNEFRHFTGLTNVSTANTATMGTFQGCTNLKEITLPPNNVINTISAAFMNCSALESVDLSPWQTNETMNVYGLFRNSGIKEVDLSPLTNIGVSSLIFNGCISLTKITTSGCTFTSLSNSSILVNCTSLTEIIGGLPGLRKSVGLASCPLSHDSAVGLLDSLGTAASGATITFKASTYNTLTANEIAIATTKGWAVNSA